MVPSCHFRAALSHMAHAHQNIYSRENPERLIRRSESFNDHIMEHTLQGFLRSAVGPHKQKQDQSDRPVV